MTVITLTLVTVSWLDMQARPITREQARQQATQFMQRRGDARQLKAALSAYPKSGSLGRHNSPSNPADEAAPYYVFNRGNQEGFIIVAGDDEVAETILGYCHSGSFVYDEMPPNMLSWLNGYAKEIEDLQARTSTPGYQPSAIRRIPTHPAISPLMTSKWSQGDPYNQECPMYFTLGRSVTGCVATAYAQILYYHRSKMVTETQAAMPAYDTWTSHPTYGNLHVEGIPAGSPIDWDHMIDSYGGSATGLQKKAVAQLMHYCGVAVNMDYTNGASGAQSGAVDDALKNYFGFGNSVKYVSGDRSAEEWDEIIYNELANQRPVYISGADADVGHAFVCDGYDGNRQYHINWGWGGQSDGNYYLSNLTPGEQGIGGSSGSGYTNGRECIIGIEPENYLERAMPFADITAKRLCIAEWDQNGDGILSYGEAASVTDLGTVLQGKHIKSFDELRYFTGLETIADDAFSGCVQLANLQLPRNLKHIGARAFKDCKKLSTINLPTSLLTIGEEAFSGCLLLHLIDLPANIKTIEAGTFRNCHALTAMALPTMLTRIGDEAFDGCSKLSELTVSSLLPQNMTIGANVFANSSVATAVLHIQQGTRAFFEGDAQWSQFGTIKEHRNRAGVDFTALTPNTQVYLYHVGFGRFLSKGEAWGTQAVVTDSEPMRFQLRHTSAMPEGVYALYSNDTGNSDRHYTFRTSDDSNVGKGVRAAFVDGNLDKRAYWQVTDIGNNTYTFSVPQGYDGYDANCRWGVQTDHESQYTQPTWGVYSDIVYEGNEQACQWRFVLYDADRNATYEVAAALENLINMAKAKRIACQDEEAVLDNMQSTIEEMRQAQKSLRQKMKLIDFADDIVAQTCRSNFDLDGDGEFSFSEASKISSINNCFQGKAITSFDEFQYFTSVKELYGSTFDGCNKLTSITLPESIERIYYYAFRNCSKLTSINLPEYVITIGDQVFSGCSQLKTVRIDNPDPSSIDLKSNAFTSSYIKTATLQVPAGTKEMFASAPVWRNFGTIEEVRTRTQPKTSPVYAGARGYVMNVATRKMITAGEAYGTQGVVGRSGFVYEWCRSNNMPEGRFYLKNVATDKVLFRTDTDTKVGDGVKACFVDGSLSDKAYWQVDSVAEGVYTLQVPKGTSGYVEGEYLGTDYNHTTEATDYYTSGIYWDIKYSGHERQCQWVFVSTDNMNDALEFDKDVKTLKDLLLVAENKGGIDTTDEQTVYDNLQSTSDDILAAIASLRRKLHYIDIADTRAKAVCIAHWDGDGDGELSIEEAAAVTDIGETFRNQSQMKSLEVLRYFTGLTEIPENAFRSSTSLATVYLPEQVKSIGSMAFAGCPMQYLVLFAADDVVSSAANGLSAQATVFVPEALVEAYLAHDVWKVCNVCAYTGTPVVTAQPASRQYGRKQATLTYKVEGAPIDGAPELQCDALADATAPVGDDYVINIMRGSITSENVQLKPGFLTITPAPLTITANSYTRKQGEDNPEFSFTSKGFRNKETVDVLLTQPVITCEATKDSPAGEYPIVISGATAQNYDITFVNGVLTIEGSSGIDTATAASPSTVLYDLQGRRIDGQLRKGLYIDRQRRRVISR